jgi:hypothetical protein
VLIRTEDGHRKSTENNLPSRIVCSSCLWCVKNDYFKWNCHMGAKVGLGSTFKNTQLSQKHSHGWDFVRDQDDQNSKSHEFCFKWNCNMGVGVGLGCAIEVTQIAQLPHKWSAWLF